MCIQDVTMLKAFLNGHPYVKGSDGTRNYTAVIADGADGETLDAEAAATAFADEDFLEDANHIMWMYGWAHCFGWEIERDGACLMLIRRTAADSGYGETEETERDALMEEAEAVREFDSACEKISRLAGTVLGRMRKNGNGEP